MSELPIGRRRRGGLRRVAPHAFLWLFGLALLAWVLQTVPLGAVASTLGRLRAQQWLLLGIANVVVVLLLPARWWLILRGMGHYVSYVSLTGFRLAAFGLSYFTPGPLFGGEPLQVVLLERRFNVPRTTAVASVTLDKTVELLVNFTFLLGGMLFLLSSRLPTSPVGDEVIALILGLLLAPIGLLWAWWHGRRPFAGVASYVGRLPLLQRAAWELHYRRATAVVVASEAQAIDFCQQRPAALILALSASMMSWLALIAEFWLMLGFLGLWLQPFELVVVMTAARVAILLPAPGGLGTLEAAHVVALTMLGIDPVAGVGSALLAHARDALLGALGLWWGGQQLRHVGNRATVEKSSHSSIVRPHRTRK